MGNGARIPGLHAELEAQAVVPLHGSSTFVACRMSTVRLCLIRFAKVPVRVTSLPYKHICGATCPTAMNGILSRYVN